MAGTDLHQCLVVKQAGHRFHWLLSALLLLGCSAGMAANGSAPECHPGRIIITPKPGSPAASLKALHRLNRGGVTREFPSVGGVQVVELPPGTDIAATARKYLQSGLVEHAEPDYARQLSLLPNDPQFVNETLWGLHNTGQQGGLPDADIDAPEAWNIRTSARDITVAVLDTGIRPTHEDLVGNIWTNSTGAGYGWNVLLGTQFPADDEGHGTLVSGVLGAVGNNGKGIAGVAWEVQLMACKCFNSQKIGYDSDIIAGIEFARTNGARIINASMGAYAYSHALSNAIYGARQAGIVFVAAAGNDGRDIDVQPYYPAAYDIDNIVSVAFTTRTDALGAASNYGQTNVDLAAPGAAMYSTFFISDTYYLGGSFLSGTSLAAPQVSGALALVMSRFPNESHLTTIGRVLNGVDPVSSLSGRCRTGGRLNLHKALSAPITLSISPAAQDAVGIIVYTSPNRLFVLESSTNLLHWTTLTEQTTSAAGVSEYSDSSQPGLVKFYRASALP